jgi:hypothetical protein
LNTSTLSTTIVQDPISTLEEEVEMSEKATPILKKCISSYLSDVRSGSGRVSFLLTTIRDPAKPAIPGEMVDRHFSAVFRCDGKQHLAQAQDHEREHVAEGGPHVFRDQAQVRGVQA